MDELRIYQITDNTALDPYNGQCPILVKLKRNSGPNSQRSFGATNVHFWVVTSCSLYVADDGSVPALENQMNTCTEKGNESGLWRYVDTSDPSLGIRYDNDVYVGKHLIVESDERIKKIS